MARRAKVAGNPVAEIIEHLGGGERAAHIAGVRAATIYGWKKAERITLLGPALRLVAAVEDDPVKRLALLKALAPDA